MGEFPFVFGSFVLSGKEKQSFVGLLFGYWEIFDRLPDLFYEVSSSFYHVFSSKVKFSSYVGF